MMLRMMPMPPYQIIADKPFVFYICHESGNILFVGRVATF